MSSLKNVAFFYSSDSKISSTWRFHTCTRYNKNSCKEHAYPHFDELCKEAFTLSIKKKNNKLIECMASPHHFEN